MPEHRQLRSAEDRRDRLGCAATGRRARGGSCPAPSRVRRRATGSKTAPNGRRPRGIDLDHGHARAPIRPSVSRRSLRRRGRRSAATIRPSAARIRRERSRLAAGRGAGVERARPRRSAANSPTSCDASSCTTNTPARRRWRPSGLPWRTSSPSGCAPGRLGHDTFGLESRTQHRRAIVFNRFTRSVSGAGSLLNARPLPAASKPWRSSQRAASQRGCESAIARTSSGSVGVRLRPPGRGHARDATRRRSTALTKPAARLLAASRASAPRRRPRRRTRRRDRDAAADTCSRRRIARICRVDLRDRPSARRGNRGVERGPPAERAGGDLAVSARSRASGSPSRSRTSASASVGPAAHALQHAQGRGPRRRHQDGPVVKRVPGASGWPARNSRAVSTRRPSSCSRRISSTVPSQPRHEEHTLPAPEDDPRNHGLAASRRPGCGRSLARRSTTRAAASHAARGARRCGT